MDRAEGVALPSGVTPGDWALIRQSIQAHRHSFEATHRGFEASNPRFGWNAQFDGTRAVIQPAESSWSFGLALKAFGFQGQLRALESPAFGTCAEAQRITYGWTGDLSEWWINDQRGFEHGFTVHERPYRPAVGEVAPLVFELDAIGSLQPRANEGRTGLTLHDGTDALVLRYDGLVAFDANGDPLPAWLEVEERVVRVYVDEARATYPIVVDPVLQDAYIKASNSEASDFFGSSVAMSGDTLVVGAPGEDSSSPGVDGDQASNASFDSGAAYVFVRNGSTWIQEAYLKASNPDPDDNFGAAVAVSGDTIVVGALWEESLTTGINGDESGNAGVQVGAAYVFVRSGSSWTQQAYLKASNAGSLDNFGGTVAVSGDTVVVGARGEASSATGVDGSQSNNSASSAGAAYVFTRTGSLWTQEAYLKASNTDQGDSFGRSIAVAGNTIVVGASREGSNATGIDGDQTSNGADESGAAYVFVRAGSSWTQEAYLKASNTDPGDRFGRSIAMTGDTIVVGAVREASSATGVDGDQANNGADNSGAAYVFVRAGSSWTQQAYLKASNTNTFDGFGASVAAAGDTVVVGAYGEDSSAFGTNGNQLDNTAGDSGAAYVFTRYGSCWIQTAYLKSSNTDTIDYFGESVAASGSTIAVGAPFEASSASGIGGDQKSNTAVWSGAVYSFEDSGGVGAQFCLTASNSTGARGELLGSGSPSVAGNDLTLVATNLPPLVFGFYLTSTVQGFAMNPGGSDGNLCLGGLIGRYVGPGQIQQSDVGGTFSLLLDLTNTPQPTGAVSINAGETWNFQGWYRDSNMSGATSNFTNGLEVTFVM